MSEIPKFEDWSRRRQVLDDENEHLIPLTPLEVESLGWWGYVGALGLVALIAFGVWAHSR